MTELELQRAVQELAGFTGWRFYHTHDSRHSVPGFPDLVLVRAPRIIFAELKSDHGKVTPDQREWLDGLASCTEVSAHEWRPNDWDSIVETLSARRLAAVPSGKDAR